MNIKNYIFLIFTLIIHHTTYAKYQYLITPMYGSGIVKIINSNKETLFELDTKKVTFHARRSKKKLVVAHINKSDIRLPHGTTGEINIYDIKTKKIVFTYKNSHLHHDFFLLDNLLYVTQWKRIPNSNLYGDELIEIDISTNKILRRLNLNTLFAKELAQFKEKKGSFTHINSINYSKWNPLKSTERNVLVLTSRKLSSVIILKQSNFELIKKYNSNIKYPHDASIIPPDKILVFNNDEFHNVSTQVMVLNGKTGNVIQRYGPKKSDPLYQWKSAAFYSPFIGGAQVLPNDNILVTIGNTGRVLEINMQNEIVWDQPALASSIMNINNHPAQQIFKVRAYLNEQ